MARYRTKDDVDLAWNKVRRTITYEVRRQAADAVEEILNRLLAEAWTEFAKSLEKGEVLVLEPDYKQFVFKTLQEVIHVESEVPSS